MQYAGVSVKHLIPSEFVLQDPASVSKAIIKRDVLRIPAHNPPNYGIGASNHTTFRLSSPQDFIDLANTYFSVTLTSDADANGFMLGQIGVHSIFDRIEVRGLGNIQIQEQQAYPDWAAIWQRIYRDHDQDYIEGIVDGRDPWIDYMGSAVAMRSKPLSTHAGEKNQLDVSAGAGGDEFLPLADANARKKEHPVDLTGDLVIKTVDPDIAIVDLAGVTVHFRPRLSFFKMMFPLFLSKSGIEIKFYYSPDPILGTSLDDTAAATQTLRVTNFEMWANFVTPHPDVLVEYSEQWGTDAGILYSLPSVRYQQDESATTGDHSFSLQFNVRSARRLLQVVKPTFINYAGNAFARSNDIANLPATLIYQYQARIGAFQYPSERVSDFLRCYENLLLSNGGKLAMTAKDWYRHNEYQVANGAGIDDFYNFIMVHDFSRYTGAGAEFTGVDLSTVPVDINIYRTAASTFLSAGGTFRYCSFLEYDAYLKLSSQQISRIE